MIIHQNKFEKLFVFLVSYNLKNASRTFIGLLVLPNSEQPEFDEHNRKIHQKKRTNLFLKISLKDFTK